MNFSVFYSKYFRMNGVPEIKLLALSHNIHQDTDDGKQNGWNLNESVTQKFLLSCEIKKCDLTNKLSLCNNLVRLADAYFVNRSQEGKFPDR